MFQTFETPRAQVLDVIGESVPCVTYDRWIVYDDRGTFPCIAGAEGYRENILRQGGPEALRQWEQLEVAMRPLQVRLHCAGQRVPEARSGTGRTLPSCCSSKHLRCSVPRMGLAPAAEPARTYRRSRAPCCRGRRVLTPACARIGGSLLLAPSEVVLRIGCSVVPGTATG